MNKVILINGILISSYLFGSSGEDEQARIPRNPSPLHMPPGIESVTWVTTTRRRSWQGEVIIEYAKKSIPQTTEERTDAPTNRPNHLEFYHRSVSDQ